MPHSFWYGREGRTNIFELFAGFLDAATIGHFFRWSGELAQQAAQLAASLPRPSTWYPGVSSRGYQKSVDRILIRMEKADWFDRLL